MEWDDVWDVVWDNVCGLVNDLAQMIVGWWSPRRNDEEDTPNKPCPDNV
jgi:hypothetical protein